ncbi:MAG: DHH family phosphoesterase [Oscillospiraceae bacterium]|nr:DHH family phosphoesterase [Oscillospiraceae bacterium]
MKPKVNARIWLLAFLLVLAVLLPSALLYWRGDPFGFLYCIPGAVIICIGISMLLYSQRNQLNYIAKLDESCENAKVSALQQLPMGFCVIDSKGVVVEYNQYFQEAIMGGDDMFGVSLYDRIQFKTALEPQLILWNGRFYQLFRTSYQDPSGDQVHTVFWQDQTDLEVLRQEHKDSRPCVVLLVVDNYEDMIQSIKERSRLAAGVSIEQLMEHFVENTTGILRRLKNDRFIAILERKHIDRIISDKFQILDEARSITVEGRNTLTLSIGVGLGGATLQECEELARQSLDMALGRGGDQAAIKTENGFKFFGGVSQGVERKYRVKVRATAGKIQQHIMDSRAVYLMGHRYGDLDSIGGCCGLAGAIRLMGKTVRVVCDPKKNMSQQLISLVQKEVGAGLFITPEQAVDAFTDDSLLIIVDTHSPDLIESPELYEKAKYVVVIDHHRKKENYLQKVLEFYHDPNSSSACEMITELLQYFKLSDKVKPIYADCLLSGITLDTKNFVMRTGVHTFEAAAYLRSLNADTIRVRNLFAGSIEAYRSRTQIVSNAEIYGRFAISEVPADTPSVRLVASQAADEMLGISGVDAAFTLCEMNDMINISARSYGTVNVQLIMEALGGGGHQSMAAAQLRDCTVEEAKEELLGVLKTLED